MAKILIVDDSLLQRKFLADALENLGYSHEQATNGQEAFDKLKNGIYDCVTLDLLMPVKDGVAVLEDIKEAKLVVPPIIIVSSNIQESMQKRCLELGAFAFLDKPFKQDKLTEVIKQALIEKST